MDVTGDGTVGNNSGFDALNVDAPNVNALNVNAPRMPGGNQVYLELFSSMAGWQFQLTGGTYSTGWRPTRAWAKRAGRRRMRTFSRQR